MKENEKKRYNINIEKTKTITELTIKLIIKAMEIEKSMHLQLKR